MKTKQALNWRYAVKKYSDKIVADEQVNEIVEAINLSASSAGLQPYRLIVVKDKALQQQLGEGSFNPQIVDASHLLVFAAFEDVTQQHIDEYMNRVATTRGIPAEQLAEFKSKLEFFFLQSANQQQNFDWAMRQSYIGLGTGLIAAAELEIDSTPMEGFDRAKFDELLNLKEKGLRSTVILSLGYRDEANDIFSKLKKVRLPIDEFVVA